MTSCLGMEFEISLREVPQWVLGATLLLMTVLVAAAGIVILAGRWTKRRPGPPGTSGGELTSFRLLYEQGELSREEYERIRSRLVPRLRKELDVPAPPQPASEECTEPRPSGSEDSAP